MNPQRLGCAALFLGAALVALYYASSNTGDTLIDPPEIQTEAQFAGVDVRTQLSAGHGNGGPLDMSAMHDLHFWAPGWTNSGSKMDDHPVVKTPHRYPVVAGGNVSTVMHKGWSALTTLNANDWYINPPEVAVL